MAGGVVHPAPQAKNGVETPSATPGACGRELGSGGGSGRDERLKDDDPVPLEVIRRRCCWHGPTPSA